MNFLKIDKSSMAIPILAFFFLLWQIPCNAWYTPMHPHITRTAFEHLPNEIQEVFEPYLDSILWESMSPDFFLRDWPNHEWNIHRAPGDNTDAPARIQALAQEIVNFLRQSPPDIPRAADKLGLLSHYLADINQPLHTDAYAVEEPSLHVQYEEDVYARQAELTFSSRGIRFRPDIYNMVINSAGQANMYYQAIIDAYVMGDDYADVRQITLLNYQRAVNDIVDVWTTLWLMAATSDTFSLALQVNQDRFRPGDMIRLTLTTLRGSTQPRKADLYVAVTDKNGALWFMTSQQGFSREISPFHKSCILSQSEERIIFTAPVEFCDLNAEVTVYALLVLPDSDLSNLESWLSDIASVSFRVEPLPEDLLAHIQDESYLFPAVLKSSGEVIGLPLQRWDFIFLGEKTDDPATPDDETLLNLLIPGDFRHVLLYLGRDSLGRPCGLEFIAKESPYLRVVRFPEFEPVYPSGTKLTLPVNIENIQAYRNRWAKRLKKDELLKLQAAEHRVFEQIARDLKTDIPYQMEYNWSGDFSDMEIELVDDGIANGASCTDYLLFLLEESAGVCIHGSRISADNVEEYFRFDPAGSRVAVPDDWNPFPFQVTVVDILDMGYHAVDPPPHMFPCDNSTETGVPIPACLINSPQFIDIASFPVSAVYDSWGQEQI